MRRLIAACLAATAVVAAGAAPASALPGDPPIELLAPAPGGSLPTDAAGITVSYTCPVYRSQDFGDGIVSLRDERDYVVLLSPSPQLDGEGRLADVVARGTGASTPADPTTCTLALGSTSTSPTPQETPGTWYWQVSRICAMCSPQFEVTEFRSFTLVTTAQPTVALPARVFAGYPFIARVRMPGAPSGTTVTLERATPGGAWQSVGAREVTGTGGEAVLNATVSGTGVQRLRARVELGGQTVVGDELRVRVRSARKSTKSTVRAGAWSGGGGVAFRVVGRTIRDFGAQVPLLCPTPGMVSQFTTQIAKAVVPSIRVAPDGSFVGASTASGAVRVHGRLSGSRLIDGHVEMSLGGCVGSANLAARRGV